MSDFSERTEHVARKQHRCFGCGDPIMPGEKYQRWRGSFEGEFFSTAEHMICGKVYDSFCEAGDPVTEDYAYDWACDSQCGEEDYRQDGESKRDYVARMVGVAKDRQLAARRALAAGAQEARKA